MRLPVLLEFGKALGPGFLSVPCEINGFQEIYLVWFQGVVAVFSALIGHPRREALVLGPIQWDVRIAKSLMI